ncbi:15530_t:CDS:2 [Entrophospora sp. SA101]|nr:12405_t:CDS:2 [Entrophospora sp. SA101]CAJ0761328.1 15530_t:CDS:2 [Entrophospora sp. SA101]CAJ0851479.1 777_t:CDS:2 [Entrophospora sp. SA101]CAJ0855726.1 17282_t:CDS:2 [Entrophospora sp. SA101]
MEKVAVINNKGTGRARSGSIRNPQFRGGGVVFGPTSEENYSLDINKKLKKKVLQSLLGEKMRNKEIVIVDKLALENYKTKEAKKLLDVLPTKEAKTLIVLADNEENKAKIICSFRNLPYVNISDSKSVNTSQVLTPDQIISGTISGTLSGIIVVLAQRRLDRRVKKLEEKE